MIKELKFAERKKLLGAVIICALTIGGLMMWYTRPVAEAAILDPHPGLVGWWRFDERSGTVAEDSSGNGNDGTIYGTPAWVDGKYGNATSFDGDDHVRVADSSTLRLTQNLTLECWVYPRSLSIDTKAMIQKRLGAGRGYAMWFYGSSCYFGVETTEGWQSLGGGAFSIDTWYHIVGVYDREAGDIVLYKDGVEMAKTTVTAADVVPGTDDLILGSPDGSSGFINAIVDEVRVYNRSLSAAEVLEVFQRTPDFSSKLLARVPKGATQVITTLSWQGIGSINITVESPTETYTEDIVPVYQKSVYSSSSGDTLNIKRIIVSVTALLSDENWYVALESDGAEDYRITVEIQK